MKPDLYRYLEIKQKEALNTVEEQFRQKYKQLEDDKLSKYGVHAEAERLRRLCEEIYDGHIAWAAQFETTDNPKKGAPKYSLNAYNGVVSSFTRYFNFLKPEQEIYNQLTEFIDLQDEELQSIKSQYATVRKQVRDEYDKLLAVVKAMRNKKKIVEYLTGLGFNSTEICEQLDIKPETALTTPINNSYLFLKK